MLKEHFFLVTGRLRKILLKWNAYLYSITLYGRKFGRRYLIMRIGSQSMSSTIDPKTIYRKEINHVSLNSRINQPYSPAQLSNMFFVYDGLALAKWQSSVHPTFSSWIFIISKKQILLATRYSTWSPSQWKVFLKYFNYIVLHKFSFKVKKYMRKALTTDNINLLRCL